MSEQVKVLVFHAKDALKDAYKIQKELFQKGFQSITLDELRSIEKGRQSGDFYNYAVNIHDYVIILISDGLFKNCGLRFPIGLAIGQGKAISASVPNSKVILPTWYKSSLRDFNKTQDEVILTIRLNFQESK